MASLPCSLRAPALRAASASSAILLALVGLSSCASAPVSGTPAASTVPATTAPTTPAVPFSFANGDSREDQVEQLIPIMNRALRGGRDFARGKMIFDTHACAFCHRFGEGTGGIGPDISGVGGRMGTDGLLTEILNPSLRISNLFGKTTVTTKNGETFTGRKMEEGVDPVILVQNYVVDPSTMTFTWNGGNQVRIKLSDVDTIEDAKDSPMPEGLIDDLKVSDVADLLAFLITGGNPTHRMFQPLATPAAAKP